MRMTASPELNLKQTFPVTFLRCLSTSSLYPTYPTPLLDEDVCECDDGEDLPGDGCSAGLGVGARGANPGVDAYDAKQ